MEKGRILQPAPALDAMADYCADQLQRMPDGSLRLVNPHIYKVGISERLFKLREKLTTNRE
jgi:nicotinate phosphoribosyltransferase